MDTTRVDFRFANSELAQALIDAKPPDGVRVTGSLQPIIRASEGADIVFRVSLHFKNHVDLLIIAAWMIREFSQHLKHRHNKKPRINDKELTPTEEEIVMLIREDIHWQQVRDAQRHEGDDKKRIEDKKSST